MKPVIHAASAAVLALACAGAGAEVRIFATWSADLVSFADPSGPTTTVGGSVIFDEPYVPFGSYSFVDGLYDVTLFSVSAHGSGVEGYDSVTTADASGTGLWAGSVVVLPEPGTAALMLAGLGLVGAVARRRKG